MTDPGKYSDGWENEQNIDVILITHEHGDHCHVDGIRVLLQHNPKAIVYTNAAVAPLLEEAGIAYTLVADGDSFKIEGVSIQGYEYDHEEIHPTLETVRNTGFCIAERLYYGGDVLQAPDIPIEILALPVAGPWMRIRDAIDFGLRVRPKVSFPVHDGILVAHLGGSHKAPGKVFEKEGIEWRVPEPGETMHF